MTALTRGFTASPRLLACACRERSAPRLAQAPHKESSCSLPDTAIPGNGTSVNAGSSASRQNFRENERTRQPLPKRYISSWLSFVSLKTGTQPRRPPRRRCRWPAFRSSAVHNRQNHRVTLEVAARTSESIPLSFFSTRGPSFFDPQFMRTFEGLPNLRNGEGPPRNNFPAKTPQNLHAILLSEPGQNRYTAAEPTAPAIPAACIPKFRI